MPPLRCTVVGLLLLLPTVASAQTYATTPLQTWGVNGPINAIERVGNRLFVGGDFNRTAITRGGLIAISGATGEPRPGFNPRLPSTVSAMAADGQGGWYVAGVFSSTAGAPGGRMIRVRGDGSRDLRFTPVIGGYVDAIVVLPDRVIAAGWIDDANSSQGILVALDPITGVTLDWRAPAATVDHLAAAPGNRLVLGSRFTFTSAPRMGVVDAVTAAVLWTPQLNWRAAWGPGVGFDFAVAGEYLYVCGNFTTAEGQPRQWLAAFDLSSRTLLPWNPAPTGRFNSHEDCSIAVAGDTVYVARTGYSAGTVPWGREAFAVSRTTGERLATWQPPVDFHGSVAPAWPYDTPRLLAAHGRVYFRAVNSDRRAVVDPYVALWAVDATTGALLSHWSPRPDGYVAAVAVDGEDLIIGGHFSGVQSQARHSLLAFDLDTGALADWNPLASGSVVHGLAIAAGRLFVQRRADFSPTPPQAIDVFDLATLQTVPWTHPPVYISRMTEVAGRIVLATSAGESTGEALLILDPLTGARSTPRLTFERTSARGVSVYTLGRGADRVYVAGVFESLNGQPRGGLAAIDVATGAVLPWAPPRTSSYVERIVPGPGVIALDPHDGYVALTDPSTGAIVSRVLPLTSPLRIVQLHQFSGRDALITSQPIIGVPGDATLNLMDLTTGAVRWQVRGDLMGRGASSVSPVSSAPAFLWPDFLVAAGGTRVDQTAAGRLLIFPATRPAPSLTASVAGRRLALAWPASEGAAPTNYRVEIGRAPRGADVFSVFIGLRNTFEIDLDDGTYYVRVRALYATGISEASNEIAVRVGAGALPPSQLRVILTDGRATLTWQPPALAGGTDAFAIEVGTSSGGTQTGVFLVPGTWTSASGTLGPGTYFVRMRSRNRSAVSAASAEVSFTIGAPPPAPRTLSWRFRQFNGTYVELTWLPPLNPAEAFTGYVIEAGSAPGLADLAQIRVSGTTLAYAAYGVPPGIYYVRVRAVDVNGVGAASNEVTVVAAGVP